MVQEDPLIPNKLVLILFLLGVSTLFCGLTPAFARELSPPETITLRVTGKKDCRAKETYPYKIQQIDFKEYVKGVLPNEWLATWPEESLKAGAVAVKMFAWSHSVNKGYVWDCNWDQVYYPKNRTEETDKAVDDTWDWMLWDSGPVRTYYDDYLAACNSRDKKCMSQWETLKDAEEGMTWEEIVLKYYDGEITCPNCVSTEVVEKPQIKPHRLNNVDITLRVKKPVYNLPTYTFRHYLVYQFEFHR